MSDYESIFRQLQQAMAGMQTGRGPAGPRGGGSPADILAALSQLGLQGGGGMEESDDHLSVDPSAPLVCADDEILGAYTGYGIDFHPRRAGNLEDLQARIFGVASNDNCLLLADGPKKKGKWSAEDDANLRKYMFYHRRNPTCMPLHQIVAALNRSPTAIVQRIVQLDLSFPKTDAELTEAHGKWKTTVDDAFLRNYIKTSKETLTVSQIAEKLGHSPEVVIRNLEQRKFIMTIEEWANLYFELEDEPMGGDDDDGHEEHVDSVFDECPFGPEFPVHYRWPEGDVADLLEKVKLRVKQQDAANGVRRRRRESVAAMGKDKELPMTLKLIAEQVGHPMAAICYILDFVGVFPSRLELARRAAQKIEAPSKRSKNAYFAATSDLYEGSAARGPIVAEVGGAASNSAESPQGSGAQPKNRVLLRRRRR